MWGHLPSLLPPTHPPQEPAWRPEPGGPNKDAAWGGLHSTPLLPCLNTSRAVPPARPPPPPPSPAHRSPPGSQTRTRRRPRRPKKMPRGWRPAAQRSWRRARTSRRLRTTASWQSTGALWGSGWLADLLTSITCPAASHGSRCGSPGGAAQPRRAVCPSSSPPCTSPVPIPAHRRRKRLEELQKGKQRPRFGGLEEIRGRRVVGWVGAVQRGGGGGGGGGQPGGTWRDAAAAERHRRAQQQRACLPALPHLLPRFAPARLPARHPHRPRSCCPPTHPCASASLWLR